MESDNSDLVCEFALPVVIVQVASPWLICELLRASVGEILE